MHAALEDDINLIQSYRSIATLFLEEAGIAVGDDRYCNLQLALSTENEREFAKVSVFIKHLFPNEDYPQGMTEEDLVQDYLQNHVLIAAIGVIELEKVFTQLSQRIAKQGGASITQCHNYTLAYWRIRELAELLQMSEVYKANYRKRQKDIAKKERLDGLGRVIKEILQAHPGYTAPEVIRQLRLREGAPPILSVTDDDIEWADEASKIDSAQKTHFTKISAIKDRVSKIKKGLKSP